MRLAANISLIVAFNNKKNVDVKLWGILLSSLSAIKKFYSLKKNPRTVFENVLTC